MTNYAHSSRGVAVTGLSGAKEAPGFRAGALQPRPPEDSSAHSEPGLAVAVEIMMAGISRCRLEAARGPLIRTIVGMTQCDLRSRYSRS